MRQSDGSPASSSASYFENMENDILDCEWPENIGLRKLLLPLLNHDQNRFRNEIVKTNVMFRRSPKVSGVNPIVAESEARPFIGKIVARVRPRLIILTGAGIDNFLTMHAVEVRPLSETIKDLGVNQVVFAAKMARMRSVDHETVVVQVAHASQFNWTYDKYGVSAKIAWLMDNATARAVQRAVSITAAMPPQALGGSPIAARPAPTTSSRNLRLAQVERSWRGLGIEPQFHQVHHFACSGRRERLGSFLRWCDRHEIKAQNNQTLERALDVARRVEAGQDFSGALVKAWAAYPKLPG